MGPKKATLSDLREMLEEYKKYLSNVEQLGKDVLKMLTLRDEIEELLHSLEERGTNVSAERTKLENLDPIARKKAKIILKHLKASVELAPYREERKIPASHWWWYLDDLIKEEKLSVVKKWLIRGGVGIAALLCAYVVLTRFLPQPEPVILLQEKGSRLYEEGRVDEAIAVYKKALKLNPEEYSIYLMLGVLYEEKGVLEEASRYFEEAKNLSPKKIDFYNQRGMIYYQRGKLDRAISDAKEALKIDPNSAASHFLLGSCYEVQGRVKEAISEYQMVSNLDTDPKLTAMARIKMGMLMQRSMVSPLPSKTHKENSRD
ncbi:hypothetical protein DRJ00_00575 [Candidatus Aerophobetes bacterium]|uniref:Uncharacterized protein n=1 Tax=Aerophobetes bacterium TaxID=2030807 RepID=A0A497E8L3_UNCAE|nr:MAG: hypothetical protein DRJ00_00575 [Candidatus Aerophobetes bacterium]